MPIETFEQEADEILWLVEQMAKGHSTLRLIHFTMEEAIFFLRRRDPACNSTAYQDGDADQPSDQRQKGFCALQPGREECKMHVPHEEALY
ncbi:MAG TPA: hypothetical protein VHX63_11785 [Acidobacteriaceae bacterium]|jgi:hypothetical protein|nr:hypothetical protein [Acidobacteriaceae bacterium]